MTPIRALILAAAAMLAAGPPATDHAAAPAGLIKQDGTMGPTGSQVPPPGHATAPSSVLEQDVKTEPVAAHATAPMDAINQDDQRAPVVQEKVKVINVEVPLRVLRDGAAVADLKKEDFRLFVDGEPVAVNGFSVRRQRMQTEHILLRPEDEAAPPRHFVLAFRILEYNDALRRAMDYFFGQVLGDRDQLLALVNERTLVLNWDVGQGRRREILEQALAEESLRAKQELEAYFQRVRRDIDQTHLKMLLDNSRTSFMIPQIINFLERYLEVWREFKYKYLTPDLDKFYNFSRYLRAIAGEKWVLSFFQIGLFPRMRPGGPVHSQLEELVEELNGAGGAAEQMAKLVSRQLEAIDLEMDAAADFPSEAVGKMLLQVDTTYHSFVSSVGREGLSEDVEYKKVASDLENTLRAITRRSGGEVAFTGDLGSALHEVAEREDVSYVLTYEPRDARHRGKLRVTLPGCPGCRLLYDDNVRDESFSDYLERKQAADPTLRLDRLSLAGRRLRAELSAFQMRGEGRSGQRGQLNVAVRIYDGDQRLLYDRNRTFGAGSPQATLEIDFTFLTSGRYLFVVEARDLLTGRAAMDTLTAQVD